MLKTCKAKQDYTRQRQYLANNFQVQLRLLLQNPSRIKCNEVKYQIYQETHIDQDYSQDPHCVTDISVVALGHIFHPYDHQDRNDYTCRYNVAMPGTE